MRTTLLIPSLLVIAACNGGSSDTRSANAPATTTTTTSTATVPFFEVIGTHGENAYDHVNTSDWAAARASVDSLITAMRKNGGANAGTYYTDLLESVSRLDTAVNLHSRIDGLRYANHVTGIGARLAEGENTPVPAAVTMLDYYGRELEIGALAADTTQLSRAAFGISTTWAGLRPQVVTRGGDNEALRFDTVVRAVTASKTPPQYAKVATPVLDQVDALEAVFTR